MLDKKTIYNVWTTDDLLICIVHLFVLHCIQRVPVVGPCAFFTCIYSICTYVGNRYVIIKY